MQETTVLVIGIVAVFVYLLILGVSVAQYILQSLALYQIAKKRAISNAWLGWIPIGSSWTLGAISDDIDSERGINRKWRVVLLTLTLIFVAVFVLFYIALAVMLIASTVMDTFDADTAAIRFLVVFYAVLILICLPATLLNVLQYICVYKIFEFSAPKKSLKYMIFSILVPLAFGICLLKCSGNCPEKPTTVLSLEE